MVHLSNLTLNRHSQYQGLMVKVMIVHAYYSSGPFTRSSQFPSYQNSHSASAGISGSPFLSGGGSRNNARSSAMIMSNSSAILSVTYGISNTVSKQNVTDQTASFDGGSDPGDDGNLGNPIPVGDGWGLLVFLGVCYGFFKRNSN